MPMYIGAQAGSVFVRKSDWQAAVNEHKKVHLLGGAALEAYVKKTQALADALPAQIEVRCSPTSRFPANTHRGQLFKALREWGRTYETVRKHILKSNIEL